MQSPYQRVLQTLRRTDDQIRFAVRCGSHVYGSAGPTSDEDFFVVLADRHAKQDLVWGQRFNVIVHGGDAFVEALGKQSIFALECMFTPPAQRLKEATPAFVFNPDGARLLASAKDRSEADYAKARARYDQEPEASLKRIFHSLRVLVFARQVAETGRIVDYTAAKSWWQELGECGGLPWAAIEQRFGALRQELLQELVRSTQR